MSDSTSQKDRSVSSGDGTEAQWRGRVETVRGHFDGGPRDGWPWVTYPTYLDGELLGHASDEAEGWRWVDDMLKLEARDG